MNQKFEDMTGKLPDASEYSAAFQCVYAAHRSGDYQEAGAWAYQLIEIAKGLKRKAKRLLRLAGSLAAVRGEEEKG